MVKLSDKNCVPCKGGVNPLKDDKIKEYLEDLDQWDVVKNHHLVKKYEFKDFMSALDFVKKISEISEKEGHHPNICFTWGEVEIKIWTHKIDGLHENDFILAAKFDEVY